MCAHLSMAKAAGETRLGPQSPRDNWRARIQNLSISGRYLTACAARTDKPPGMGMSSAFPLLRVREPRMKVCIPARLRLGAQWTDAFILNVSSRGLLIQSSGAVERGMYVELRREDQVIIGRIVWRSGSRAGLRAQDRVPLESIVTAGAVRSKKASSPLPSAADRRRSPRRDQQHARSRLRGRAMEFASVAAVGGVLSIAAVSLVAEAVTQPFAKVRNALSGQASLPVDSR
jgi:hypothetical protein